MIILASIFLSEEYLMGHLEEEGHEVVREAAEVLQLLQNQMFLNQILRNLKKAIRAELQREEKEDLVKILELIKEEKIVKIKTRVKTKIP